MLILISNLSRPRSLNSFGNIALRILLNENLCNLYFYVTECSLKFSELRHFSTNLKDLGLERL